MSSWRSSVCFTSRVKKHLHRWGLGRGLAASVLPQHQAEPNTPTPMEFDVFSLRPETHLQFFPQFLPTADGVAFRLPCLEWPPGFWKQIARCWQYAATPWSAGPPPGFAQDYLGLGFSSAGTEAMAHKAQNSSSLARYQTSATSPMRLWRLWKAKWLPHSEPEEELELSKPPHLGAWRFFFFSLDLGILCRCGCQAYDLSNSSCQHNGFWQPCRPCRLLSLRLECPAVSVYTLSVSAYS